MPVGPTQQRTLYNPKLHAQIVRDLRNGAFLGVAAHRAGISRERIRHWRRCGEGKEGKPADHERFSQFAIDCAQAIAEAEQKATETWHGVAAEGVFETITEETFEVAEDGTEKRVRKVVRTTKRLDWRAAQAYLQRRHHQRWGDRQKLEHQGKVDLSQQVVIHDGPAQRPDEQGEEDDDAPAQP